MRTPWGESDSVTVIADGIVSVTTPSHGGILLSTELHDQMPAEYRKTFAGGRWYEEDCDWAKVAVTFPEHFEPHAVNSAMKLLEAMKRWH